MALNPLFGVTGGLLQLQQQTSGLQNPLAQGVPDLHHFQVIELLLLLTAIGSCTIAKRRHHEHLWRKDLVTMLDTG